MATAVDVAIATYYPPPTPFEQNATWHEVNKRLNANVQMNTRDANGDPKLSPGGNQNAGYVPWRYISQHPYVTYQADLPGCTKRSFDVEQMLVANGVPNVTNGYTTRPRRTEPPPRRPSKRSATALTTSCSAAAR